MNWIAKQIGVRSDIESFGKMFLVSIIAMSRQQARAFLEYQEVGELIHALLASFTSQLATQPII